jgi:hypothetical protein
MADEKTQKAWAFLTASVRLCTDAHRLLDPGAPKDEVVALESAISDLLKVKAMIGRRLR